LDPNPQVNGQGVAVLRAARIQVDGPVLEAEARQLIAPFLARVKGERPYVTLKWAESADGRVAGVGGRPVPISNAVSRLLVHDLRARSEGILVGVNTILTDDPLLNARLARTPRHPRRFVLDRRLRTPVEASVVRDRSASTTIFAGHDTSDEFRRRRDALETAGVEVTVVADDERGLRLADVMRHVAEQSCFELLVEPGPKLAAGFFAAETVVDRVWVFRSPTVMGEPTAPVAVRVPVHYVKTGEAKLAGDVLAEYLNPRSPYFFAPEGSADLVLAAPPEL
jgi:diaminohydroxyphosphoribosylaminopyrimidine deaminase/5-amino-6-(5-phosphoribosylamino)uracil reductase